MPPWAGDEIAIRLTVFGAAFLLFALVEIGAPRRQAPPARTRRWPTNLGLMVLGAVLIRIALPLAVVEAGALATDRGWGLLGGAGITTSNFGVVAAVIALDFAIYAQHVLMHRVPVLWRLHRVHHADPAFDTSTGLRFHPLESLLSAAFKVALVVILGASAVAVVTFEILLNVSSMFNHANLRLPLGVDRVLRRILVTPDMHRVHHSVTPTELNHNFGFALPWWDWLCGTYQAQPAAPHETMAIGLPSIAPARAQRLLAMLVEPFRAPAAEPGVRVS